LLAAPKTIFLLAGFADVCANVTSLALRLAPSGNRPEKRSPGAFSFGPGGQRNALEDFRSRANEQYRTRLNADAICKVVADWMPVISDAIENCRFSGAYTFGESC
jgi:hypothetical protein